jgi:hypothetical protein
MMDKNKNLEQLVKLYQRPSSCAIIRIDGKDYCPNWNYVMYEEKRSCIYMDKDSHLELKGKRFIYLRCSYNQLKEAEKDGL